ncbi:hypothetical protein TSUD_380750 [Trifolium subterraneum]|uniref:Uncharacterized protein n=1 Tax=Trifolium subterraneum TaxID=3900 RepID=A0A2Z6NP87_TRISU|nr:hypothetical protein TSUD_380750 [Trifolium subterraneum]
MNTSLQAYISKLQQNFYLLSPFNELPQSSIYLHGVKVTFLMTHKSKKKIVDYPTRAATADYHTCKEPLYENIQRWATAEDYH